MTVNDYDIISLVDTRCSRTVIFSDLASCKDVHVNKAFGKIIMMNDTTITYGYFDAVHIQLRGVSWEQSCLVSDTLPGFKMLLGMDIINLMVGVTLSNGGISFANTAGLLRIGSGGYRGCRFLSCVREWKMDGEVEMQR